MLTREPRLAENFACVRVEASRHTVFRKLHIKLHPLPTLSPPHPKPHTQSTSLTLDQFQSLTHPLPPLFTSLLRTFPQYTSLTMQSSTKKIATGKISEKEDKIEDPAVRATDAQLAARR